MAHIVRYLGAACLIIALGLAGCAPEKQPPPTQTLTTPIFDPLSAPVQVPTPTDLVRNQDTGILSVPIDPKSPQAQQLFNGYLNTLNGFPPSATVEARFSSPLKADTVNATTIKVVDATYSWPLPVEGLTFTTLTETTKDATGKTQTTGLVRIFNPTGWTRGRTYVVFVLGGKSGVKDAEGKELARAPLFDMVLGNAALCEWDATKSPNAKGACLATEEGKVATGCCVQVSSNDLANLARSAETGTNLAAKELETKSQARALLMGHTLEKIRRGYSQLGSLALVADIDPATVVLAWNFSIASANEAIFDPTGSPPQIPLPSDLLRDAKSGLVQIPTFPTTGDAEKRFTAYLNTLDGYSLSATSATLDFKQAVVPKSVETGMLAFRLSGKDATLLEGTKISYNADTKRATLQLQAPLERGSTYMMIALGGAKGIQNEDTSITASPRRSALMQLVLSSAPLCTCEGKTCDLTKGQVCDVVAVSSFVDDPKGQTGGLTGIQKAMLFEGVRQQYAPLLQAIGASGKAKVEDIIALWSYTTTSLAELTFDPTTGVIPFPNDLLRDPKTGKVNIPAQPGESESAKQLRLGLNTLDGFTTLGSYYLTYTGKIDKDSVKLGESVVILDLSTGAPSTDWKLELVETAPAIVATPTKPLKEKTQYAIVMLSKRKEGSVLAESGLKDDKGRRVAAAPFMALLRNPHPLTKDGKSTVSLLDDATAAQAEPARKAHEPLFKALDAQKIDRLDIVAAWTFTTQTITNPLVQLRALPWQVLSQIDKAKPKWEGTLVPTSVGFPPGIPKDAIGNWVPQGTFTTWIALDENGTGAFLTDPTKGRAAKVTFSLTLPKTPAPQGGYPVVVYQHGITRARTDALALANSLAQAGLATLTFDLLYHGTRTRCTQDSHCEGTCDTTDGTCSSGFKDEDKDTVPDASGLYFLRTDNPFATRDNFRQHVIDAASLLRGIVLGAASGITSPPPDSKPDVVALNPDKVYLLGHSLGAILGTLVLATDSLPKQSVLNVPGAPLVDIIFTSPRFKEEREGILKAQNVTEGSLDYLRLLTTFKWIMDPADAANFAIYVREESLPDLVSMKDVTKKSVMVMLAGQDATIPIPLGQFFAKLLGVSDADLQKTTYPKQGHSFMLQPDPASSLPATVAAQKQIATYFATGKICTPDADKGECQ